MAKKVTIAVKQPPVDSLKLTTDEIAKYKGKKFDPTKGGNNTIKTLVDKYVKPEIEKYKEKSDSLYDYNKGVNPSYQGVPAKDLDKVTAGKGKHMINVSDAYSGYRKLTDVQAPLKATPLPTVKRSVPSFGGSGVAGEEKLYVPDRELTKKIAARKKKEAEQKQAIVSIPPKSKSK